MNTFSYQQQMNNGKKKLSMKRHSLKIVSMNLNSPVRNVNPTFNLCPPNISVTVTHRLFHQNILSLATIAIASIDYFQ